MKENPLLLLLKGEKQYRVWKSKFIFYLHPLAVEKKCGRPIDASSRLREREKQKAIRWVVKLRSDFNLLPLAQWRISSASPLSSASRHSRGGSVDTSSCSSKCRHRPTALPRWPLRTSRGTCPPPGAGSAPWRPSPPPPSGR